MPLTMLYWNLLLVNVLYIWGISKYWKIQKIIKEDCGFLILLSFEPFKHTHWFLSHIVHTCRPPPIFKGGSEFYLPPSDRGNLINHKKGVGVCYRGGSFWKQAADTFCNSFFKVIIFIFYTFYLSLRLCYICLNIIFFFHALSLYIYKINIYIYIYLYIINT